MAYASKGYESVRNSYVWFHWSIRPIRSHVRPSHVNNMEDDYETCKFYQKLLYRYIFFTLYMEFIQFNLICFFDLQFSRSTRPMTSFCIFIAYIYINTGNSFKLQNYKMRLKQIRLNWINSMQVNKIIFLMFFSPDH
jgi:hypothetical protein